MENTNKYRIVYQNTSLEAREGTFLVGRSPECHLVLDDPSVSRVHCAILLEDGALYGEDRGSRNGVIVNGDRVKGRFRLKDGDAISIGRQKISIKVSEQAKHSEHTQGLNQCGSCGSWIPSTDYGCARCGSPIMKKRGTRPLKETRGDPPPPFEAPPSAGKHVKRSSVIERHPIAMMAGLALKAVRVNRAEEGIRLIANAISSANERLDREGKISDDEFSSIIDALLVIAEEAKSPTSISDIFAIHLRAHRLMSRHHVQKLYDIVRLTGYRVCQEMSRYLAYLDENETKFSPGERFIHKRVHGLVKLCS